MKVDSQIALQKFCLKHQLFPFGTSRSVEPLAITKIDTLVDASFYERKPTVTIFIIAYNHEKYIAHAIESILEQNFNEPYEILISDDASTDKTLDVCRMYQQKYPDKIAVITAHKNTAAQLSGWVRNMGRGTYYAFLEGDDYWCSPTRLARQIDLMKSSHADVCFGRTDRVLHDGTSTGERMGTPLVYTASIGANPRHLPHLSSWLFSSTFYHNIKQIFGPLAICTDSQIVPIVCAIGKVVVLPEVVSCYRLTGAGIWTSLSISDASWFAFKQWILNWAFIPKCYRTKQLWHSVQHAFFSVLKYSQKSKEEQNRIEILKKCWKHTCPWWNIVSKVTFYHKMRKYMNRHLE